ncbi:MAG: helicase HerA-like domain-containing protein [Adlercreutzia equolifaciens]
MLEGDKIKVAQGENPCYLLLNQANRHGLIAGASGTGKTVTMKVLAEGFAQAGVPVFMADVKATLTGMAQPGDDTEKVRERCGRSGAPQAGSLGVATCACGICSAATACPCASPFPTWGPTCWRGCWD